MFSHGRVNTALLRDRKGNDHADDWVRSTVDYFDGRSTVLLNSKNQSR